MGSRTTRIERCWLCLTDCEVGPSNLTLLLLRYVNPTFVTCPLKTSTHRRKSRLTDNTTRLPLFIFPVERLNYPLNKTSLTNRHNRDRSVTPLPRHSSPHTHDSLLLLGRTVGPKSSEPGLSLLLLLLLCKCTLGWRVSVDDSCEKKGWTGSNSYDSCKTTLGINQKRDQVYIWTEIFLLL